MKNSSMVRFYLYRVISRLYFYLPVLVIIFLKSNLALFQTGILLAVYGLTIVLFQISSGIIADRWGRKNSIGLGELLKALGLFLLWIGDSVGLYALGQVFCGLGYVLASGADSAFLYASLSDLGRADEYRKHEARSASFMFVSVFVAGVIGGLATNYSLKLSLLLTIPTTLLAAVVAFSFREPRYQSESINQAGLTTLFQYISGEHPNLILYMLLYATIRAFILASFVGFIPVLLFLEVEVSLIYFGLILGSFSLVSFMTARNAGRIVGKLGVEKTVAVVFIDIFVALAILVFWRNPGGVFVPAIIGFSAGLIRPWAIGNINEMCQEPSIRASLISSAEFLYGVINIFLLMLGFSLFYLHGISMSFVALSITFVIISGCLLLVWLILRRRREIR